MARALTMANVRPVRIVGGRSATSGVFRLDLDERALARGRALVDRYQGAPLRLRMEKGTLAAARSIEPAMKAATPVGPTRYRSAGRVTPGGLLRRRTRAQQISQRVGFQAFRKSVNAQVGPTSPHRHLVIRGHRIVTPGGRDTGRRSRPNPYVDAVAGRLMDRAVAEMRRYIFDSSYSRVI